MIASWLHVRIARFAARRAGWYPAIAALLIFVPACSVEPQGEGPGHRRQDLALTPAEELAIGRETFQQILSKSRAEQSGPAIEKVRTVGRRIADVINIEPLMREINLHVNPDQFAWEYAVLKREQVNAFCLPGGKICVFSGLLNVVENDDQLAAVMSHEIAHALAHHISERIAHERATGGGLLSLSFDRRQELEADHIGVFLMTFAGYDPDQALEFWQRMQRAPGRVGLPEILSDHPSDAHRMQQLKSWIPMAKAAKRAYDEGQIAPAR